MNYSGTIRFQDDEGNVAFEHELNAEDIIYVLAKALKGRAENQAVAQTPAKRTYTKRKQDEVQAPKHSARKFGAKPCCGSKGSRHFLWCEQVGGVGGPSVAPKKKLSKSGERHAFSESTYDSVRKMLETETAEYTSSVKGLDEIECRRVNLANDYQDYLEIA